MSHMVQVNAPMVGKITSINAKVGAFVKKNDVLITLEAMQMQFKVYAPNNGEVSAINVSFGDIVNTETVMVILK